MSILHDTKSLWRVYVTTVLQAAGAPLIDKGVTTEPEGLKREGDAYVIRPPFTKHRPVRALVIGIWRKPK